MANVIPMMATPVTTVGVGAQLRVFALLFGWASTLLFFFVFFVVAIINNTR